MSACRAELAAALTALKRVDKETSRDMTSTTDKAMLEALRRAEPSYPGGTTDTTLLAAALEQAGRLNRVQAEQIEAQHTALLTAEETVRTTRHRLAALQQEYQSLADRFSENWPTNTEMARTREWVTQLQGLLASALQELSAARHDAAQWQQKYYGSYDASAPIYAEGAVEPWPRQTAAAAATDEEMLG